MPNEMVAASEGQRTIELRLTGGFSYDVVDRIGGHGEREVTAQSASRFAASSAATL